MTPWGIVKAPGLASEDIDPQGFLSDEEEGYCKPSGDEVVTYEVPGTELWKSSERGYPS